MKKKNGQRDRLLKALQAGKKITRLSALTDLGIFELSARVVELEEIGHTIDRKRIVVTNRFDESVRVMEYSIG